jgi:hypothetical protein
MVNLPETRIVCVFGRRGQGKTSALRALVKHERRVIVWDIFREHRVVWTDTLEDLIDYLEANPERFRVGLSDVDTSSGLHVLVVGKATGNCTIVLEEVDLLARPAYEPKVFREVVAQGRHWGLSLFCTSRRPAEVSRLLTSQASDVICFATHEPRDIAYLRAVIGDDAERLINLPPLTCLHWRPNELIQIETVDPAKAELIDTSPSMIPLDKPQGV